MMPEKCLGDNMKLSDFFDKHINKLIIGGGILISASIASVLFIPKSADTVQRETQQSPTTKTVQVGAPERYPQPGALKTIPVDVVNKLLQEKAGIKAESILSNAINENNASVVFKSKGNVCVAIMKNGAQGWRAEDVSCFDEREQSKDLVIEKSSSKQN